MLWRKDRNGVRWRKNKGGGYTAIYDGDIAMLGCGGFVLLAAVAGVFFCTFIGCSVEYSSGKRTGVVTKISKKGLVFKTWEGEMQLGGVLDGSGSFSGQTWKFTVQDDVLADRLAGYSESGERVTVRYEQPFLMPYAEGASGSFVREVVHE